MALQPAVVVTPDDDQATHFPPPGSPATVATPATVARPRRQPHESAAAPAIDVLDDDVLDNCLGFLDVEDELLRAHPGRGVRAGGRSRRAAREAKCSCQSARDWQSCPGPGGSATRRTRRSASRASPASPRRIPQLNVAVALWFADNQDGTGPLVDDAKVARQLWAFVDEVGDGAAVLNDAIDVRPHRVRQLVTEVGIRAAGTLGVLWQDSRRRGGGEAARRATLRRRLLSTSCDRRGLRRRPPRGASRGRSGRRRTPSRADGARGEDAPLLPRVRTWWRCRRRPRGDLLRGRASGRRRPLLLPRAELAVVAHWDAEDVAGAVAALREVDVSGALARWQLLVDGKRPTGAFGATGTEHARCSRAAFPHGRVA